VDMSTRCSGLEAGRERVSEGSHVLGFLRWSSNRAIGRSNPRDFLRSVN
jgi:hypothetical protein